MNALTDLDGAQPTDISPSILEQQIQSKQPLVLPWHRYQTVRLGTLFHSSLQHTSDPWSKTSPFDLIDLALTPRIVQRDIGTNASYRSVSTSSTSNTCEHLALGFGASVGLPIPIVEIGVKGQYDKDVEKNDDADKTSVRASVRSGKVTLSRQPRLTGVARSTLKYHGGLTEFHRVYGDYYLAGYRFGADTGILISGSASSTKEIENYQVDVTAEVLLIKDTVASWSKEFQHFSSCRSLKLVGFDTLDSRNWSYTADVTLAGSSQMLQQQAYEIIERSQSLVERVDERLDDLNYLDGDAVTYAQCEELTRAGLVVELMLLPVSNIREVLEWRLDDNII